MKNGKFILILFSLFFFLLSFPLTVQSQEVDNQMANFIQNMPLVNAPLVNIVFNVIRYLLGFLGVIAVVVLIYGGFLWMTARGNEGQVQKAKKTLINGLIGLIIVMLSFAIVQFVVGSFLRGGEGGPGAGGGGGGPGGWPAGARYLVVTSKYPRPGVVVARNNKIVITFNQNLDESSVKLARPDSPTTCPEFTVSIQQGNNYLDGSLKVRGNALIFVPKTDCPSPLDAVACQPSNPQNCSLELTPDGCCGCFPVGSISVTLKGGVNGLKGTRTFGNTLARDINWNFNVGNYLETNPPRVESNLPQGSNIPRNVGISVIFSKEIDLSTLKIYNPNCKIGSADCNVANCGIDNCLGYAVGEINKATVKITSNDIPIPGFFERLSTRAFIFRPSSYCPPPAQNCRCLPANSTIKIELTDEIKDVNCNALAEAPFSWTFTTSSTVDLTPPEISPPTNPADGATGIDRLTNIQATFNENMDPTSVNEDTFVVRPDMLPREIISSSNSTIFTYRPYRVLEPNTQYSPIIFGGGQPGGSCQLEPDSVFGVKDLAGNAMVNNYLWNFTTSYQVNTGAPYIDWVSPTQGPKGQCVTIHGYNLGCCLNNPCSNDLEAQKGKWTGTFCQNSNTDGQVEFFKEWSGHNPVYTPSTILVWREINQPEKCVPPNCPVNCLNTTCPTSGANPCSECIFCSKPPNQCGNCWCSMPPGYSSENEIIVRVPTDASNQSPSQPGQIKVTPAP